MELVSISIIKNTYSRIHSKVKNKHNKIMIFEHIIQSSIKKEHNILLDPESLV